MEWRDLITLLIAALGGGGIGHSVLDGIRARRSGKARAEREQTTDLLTRARTAEARADAAEVIEAWSLERARIALEHAAAVRMAALVGGISLDKLPVYPELPPRPPQCPSTDA